MKFAGKILIIGCGSVSQCAIPLVLKLVDMPASRITILDFADNRSKVQDALDRGVKYVNGKITPENYKSELSKHVGPGDMIFIPAEEPHRLRASKSPLFYFEFQAPNRFVTTILDGTQDDLRWNRIEGGVWVQT